MRTPISVAPVPEDLREAYRRRGAHHIARACWIAVRATLASRRDPAAVGVEMFGRDDPAVELIARAAQPAATTGMAGWAAELVDRAVADYLAGLSPESAAAALMSAGAITIPIANDFAEVSVPYVTSLPVGGIITEGAPIPSAVAPFASALLMPVKAGFGVALSKELAAAAGGATVLTRLLRESASKTWDSLVFSTSPPGLLASVVPLTGSLGPDGPLADLTALAAAVNGSGTVFVAGTAVAAALSVRNDHKAVIFPSGGIPSNRVIAVDARAIIFGVEGTPNIAASEEAVWHADSEPLPIGTPGSPPTIASPTYSMFQTGQVLVRLLVTASWAKRSPTAVAYLDTPDGWGEVP